MNPIPEVLQLTNELLNKVIHGVISISIFRDFLATYPDQPAAKKEKNLNKRVAVANMRSFAKLYAPENLTTRSGKKGKTMKLWEFKLDLEMEHKTALGKKEYDFYLANPEKIPNDWKDINVFFFGEGSLERDLFEFDSRLYVESRYSRSLESLNGLFTYNVPYLRLEKLFTGIKGECEVTAGRYSLDRGCDHGWFAAIY